jgi:hypothetical protein
MTNPLNLPSPKAIIELVKKEGIIRLSKEYIKQCDDVANEVNGWLRITGEMQEKLVRDAGFKGPGFDIALNMFRRSQYLYPDNEHVKNLVYVKHNKANQGRFKVGDTVEDIQLYNQDGNTKVGLHQLINGDNRKINIIFAASHT